MGHIKLFYYDLMLRLSNQYSSTIKKFIPTRKVTAKSLFLITILLKVLGIIPIYLAILYFNSLRTVNILYILFMLLIISGLYHGISSFKHTSLIRSKMYLYAPITMQTVYNLLQFSSLTWSLFNQVGKLLLFFVFSFHYLIWTDAILLSVNMFLLYIFVFSLSSKLFSIYNLNKIRRPVGLVRLTFYIISSGLSFIFGYGLVHYLNKPFQIIRNDIVDIQIFQDDAYASHVALQLILSFINPLKEFANRILLMIAFAIETYGTSVFTVGFLFILILSLQFIKIRPLVSRYDTVDEKKDIMYYLLMGLSYINEKIIKNELLTYEILLLTRERFLVSPKFFSMIFLTLESIFYIGMVFAIFHFVEGGITQYIVYLGFTLLMLFNHSFELRTEFPHIFLLGASKKKLALYKYSGCTTKELYRTKLTLMRLLLISPSLILICTSVVFGLSDWKYLLAIFFILFTYYFAPLIQMWAATFLIKTDYVDFLEIGLTEEEEWINKLQAIPRKVFVLPILFILYSMLFISWNQTMLTVVFLIYVVHYLLGGLLPAFFLRKWR